MKKIEQAFLFLIFIAGFLPAFSAIDKMTFQWLYLSIVLIFYFLYKIFYNPKINLFPFVFNYSILSFLVLLVLSILSISNALNLSESLIELSRLILLFSILLVFVSISYNLNIDKNFIFQFFSFLLLLECLYFFGNLYYAFTQYGIINFKGISSNVNIQAFSILLKLPLLIYAFKQNLFPRYIYYLTSILSIIIIFLISSRAALFGLFCILIFYVVSSKKRILYRFFNSLSLVSFSFIAYIFFIIPNISSSSKLLSLSLINSSTLDRLSYYKEAFATMLSYPLFGIGIGNWKIFGIGTHQNLITSYTTPYHVHNDFLQFGAELGFLGFFSFLLFLVFPLLYMYRLRLDNNFKFLLPSFLLVFFIYFLDSSLNFPISRPLIQIQFLFIIASIFYFYHKDLKSFIFNKSYLFLFPFILVIISFSSYKVYHSYVKQDSLLNDFNKQEFVTSLEYIETIDDAYPNITATALPIKAIKANYYSNDTIVSRLLDLSIKDNPYIKYPQALKSIRFKDQGLLDSSLYFARDAFNAIPLNELHAIAYLSILTTLKDSIAMDSVFNITKPLKSQNIWNAYLSDMLSIGISFNKTKLPIFNEAIELFPKDNRFEFYKRAFVMGDSLINQTKVIFNKATAEFDQKNYSKSAKTYLDGSKLDPTDPSFLENAGHAYYLNKDKNRALTLFDSVINHYPKSTGKAYYLKGLITVETSGDLLESCRLFNIAKKRGNLDAEKAIKLFCK